MKRFLFFPVLLCIMNAWGQVYILNEDFSTATGTTPPLKWSNNIITGQTTDLWHFSNPGSRTVNYPVTAPFAIFDATQVSNDGNPEVVSLETPYFDASVGNYTLLFLDHLFVSAPGATGTILAFNGSTWTEVTSFVSDTGNPRHEVIDLTTICAGKTNAKLRFQWEGNGAGYWAVDNISIYAPLLLDAGISSIDSPYMPFNSGEQTVKVTLSNLGYATLSGAKINWSVNGVLQPSFQWQGSVPNGSSQSDISIGTYFFQPGLPAKMKIWSDLPNGNPDLNHQNDSIMKVFIARFCGNYTIGGNNPDFKTFNEAVSILANAGITCPVAFKVRNGTYPEQIEINPVPGSSATNTVTFESESGDNSKVTLSNNAGPAFKINGAKNILMNKLGFHGGTLNGGISILIDNLSENIVVSNCKITTGWYCNSIHILNGAKNVLIYKNNFEGTSEGMHNTGIYMSNISNVKIDSNVFTKYETGIYGGGKLNQVYLSANKIDRSPTILGFNNDSVYITKKG